MKTAILQIYWSFEDSSSHRHIVQHLLLSLLGEHLRGAAQLVCGARDSLGHAAGTLSEYLNARRFYATDYLLTGVPEMMVSIRSRRPRLPKAPPIEGCDGRWLLRRPSSLRHVPSR